MTSLAHSSVDEDTYDLLSLVADAYSAPGKVRNEDFRAACLTDAFAHDGWVSVSRVSALMHERHGEIAARSFSAKWAPACGPNGFMDVTDVNDPIDPKHSKGNGGKSTKLRRWRGWSA